MKQHMPRLFAFALTLALIISFLPAQAQPAYAVSPNIVISQVYGAGGNAGATYNKDYVELFNLGTSTINLAGLSLQYASATGNFNSAFALTGSVAPGQYYLVAMVAGSNGAALPVTPDLNGTLGLGAAAGKVILANGIAVLSTCGATGNPCSASLYVDLVGYGTTATVFEGSGPTPAPSTTRAVFRGSLGCTETDNNNTDFTAAAPAPRNSGSPVHYCTSPTNPTGVGTATPNMLFVGDTTLLTVAVTPGTNPATTGHTVTCDLSAIGGVSSQTFYDDGTNGGDLTAGDNIFSFSTTVAGGTTAGVKSMACTISDTEGRPGSATIGLTVSVILPIGTVQGVVNDGDDGALSRSPYAPATGTGAGQTVVVQGVIYETTLQAISSTSSNTYKGFFIQNTAATADGDPNTSDGLFVFMNQTSTMSGPSGPYTPTVGDEVVISGSISEYYFMTELSNPTLIKPVLRSNVNLDAELAPVVADPPVSLADANRYWERLESMRVQVPLNSIVLGGRNVFSPADAEIWVANPDSTIAQRANPYERRAFRDAHILDDNYNPINWDGNGYRILMGSLGIKATEGDSTALIAPARTFDTLTNAPVGGVNYTFSKYRIEIVSQPAFSEGVDTAANNPPQNFDRSLNYSIADYNLENLYDYRDNPFSGCDFANVPAGSNPKCSAAGTPFLSDVTPAYDYVPASEAAYQARITDIAHQIIDDLHSPDILMLQEVENQDICSVVDGTLACGVTNNADGQPDVLQDLALKVASLGGPAYQTAFDRDSSDLRGILPAFMYRSDRVELAPAAGDPLLDGSPAIDGYTAVPYDSDLSNPKTLNAVYTGTEPCETSWVFPRAPDIALFRIYSESVGVGSYRDVYVINNHFKSGPDSCVAHRTEQANYNAAIVAFLQAANPTARIVVGGDLNVYPHPDNTSYGAIDQLAALYDPAIGLTNLWDVLLGQAPESAYSYVYLGMAQTLDQMFINQPMLADLNQFRIAHINSDFPADYPSDVARGTSDHDPNMAAFVINDPPTAIAATQTAIAAATQTAIAATQTAAAMRLTQTAAAIPIPAPVVLPGTGFAPQRVTVLSAQPAEKAYAALGDLWLEIPKLGVKMPIVGVPQTAGKWDVSWLGSDAGWLQGSAFPTWAGNSVLTGHVWNANNTAGPFRYINTLWWGDKVVVHAWGAQYVYQVRSVMQVGPGNTNAMLKHQELPWVTLITCRGFDQASNSYKYRVLVRAVLIEVK